MHPQVPRHSGEPEGPQRPMSPVPPVFINLHVKCKSFQQQIVKI